MTNNDPLQTAATHLAAARRLGTELASKSLFSRLRRKNAKNVIDFSDEGEFVRLTLTNKKNHEQFSNFFYRVLVKYSDVD